MNLLDNTLCDIVTYDSRAEWLAARRNYITASDVAAICGNFSWSSPKRVYEEKVEGKSDYDDSPKWGRQPMYWGSALEACVVAFFQEVEGGTIIHWPKWTLAISKKYPWLAVTPDALWIPKGEVNPILLEVKCTQSQAMYQAGVPGGLPHERQIPEYHRYQTTTQMIVTGIHQVILPALIQGNETVKCVYNFDPGLADVVLTKSRDFYDNHLVKRVPPVTKSNSEIPF